MKNSIEWSLNGSVILCGEPGHFLAVLANEVRGSVGIKLANGGNRDVAHGGVAEFDGENAKAGGSGRVVGSRD